jgi:hypothetical protein
MTLYADFNPNVSVPFYRARQVFADAGGGLQAGVLGVDYKVVQRGAGANMSVDVPAGRAWVSTAASGVTSLVHCVNDATANVVVTASHATLPRIDQILLRYNDSTIPTGSGDIPTLEVSTGTATSGATLDNRTGATTPTGSFLRLADILVPAASTSVVTANIRDRRPWARGAYNRIVDTGGDYTSLTSTVFVALSTTRLRVRIECSGVMLRVTSRLRNDIGATAGNTIHIAPLVDSALPTADLGTAADQQFFATHIASGLGGGNTYAFDLLPAAGSHLFDLAYKVAGTTPSGSIRSNSTAAVIFIVEEIVRPSFSNT